MIKILLWAAVFFTATLQTSCQNTAHDYVCPPCEAACDTLTFEEDGVCPHCKMNLIMYTDEASLNEITLKEGSGNFLIEGGQRHKEKSIKVFFHRPSNFGVNTRVLFVLPGAGRNGDDYRDAWVEASEKHNVLVISPRYSEEHYPQFWSYNLAGMITDVTINKERTAMTGFHINEDSEAWIFNDLDRIFKVVKKEFQLTTATYDMFGHSAGGQLLHRLAIFKSGTKANRILASNAGWYTVPDNNAEFPVGLKNSMISAADVDFESNLVVFLGEKDDANETRGDLRRSPELDEQGLHRLARGYYFYESSKRIAKELGVTFNWQLEIVPNVGHDHTLMSKAAAVYLYELTQE